MNIEEIKAWLKRSRMTRQEFAERLGVAKGTVDIWLSGARPIGEAKLKAIKIIMEQSRAGIRPAPPANIDTIKVINILLTPEEEAFVMEAVEHLGTTPIEFARLAILDEAEAINRQTEEETGEKSAAPA